MNRALFEVIDEAERLLGECFREARAQREWRAMAGIQVARGRLQYVLASYAPQFEEPHPMQLSLVPDDAGRKHADEPA